MGVNVIIRLVNARMGSAPPNCQQIIKDAIQSLDPTMFDMTLPDVIQVDSIMNMRTWFTIYILRFTIYEENHGRPDKVAVFPYP